MVIITLGILFIAMMFVVVYSLIAMFLPTILMMLQYRRMGKKQIEELDENLKSLKDLM